MSRQSAWKKCLAFSAGTVAVLVCALNGAAADPSSMELIQTIVLKGKPGKLDHLTGDSKGERLFLANKVNNTLDVVDLKGGKLLKQIAGQSGVQGLAYAADLDRVYAALGTGGFCNVFNGKDYALLKTVNFTDDADNVRYNPKTNLVYVAHAEKALGVLDGKSMEKKADVKLPGTAEGFQIETGRPRIYLCMPSPSELVVIDTEKNEVATRYPIKMAEGAHPLGVDEANHRLFIGCRKKPMVVVMDSETGKEITGVDIPGDIDDLFFDAKQKRIYTACGEGFIGVIKQIDADRYELVEKVPTVADARTCWYDPDTARLYLGVPRQPNKEGPEIRVYQTH